MSSRKQSKFDFSDDDDNYSSDSDDSFKQHTKNTPAKPSIPSVSSITKDFQTLLHEKQASFPTQNPFASANCNEKLTKNSTQATSSARAETFFSHLSNSHFVPHKSFYAFYAELCRKAKVSAPFAAASPDEVVNAAKMGTVHALPKKETHKAKTALAASSRRTPPTFCVLGHVDSGKSTLLGHLLVLSGAANINSTSKNEKQQYASLLDTTTEERTRGVTKDISIVRLEFKTPHACCFNVIDCPGHVDFVPNAVHGIVQADGACIVVDVSHGNYEAGVNHQTKEHLQLLRGCGLLAPLIVVLNKCDRENWDADRLNFVREDIGLLVERLGFQHVKFVAVSAAEGTNLVQRRDPNAPSLVEVMQRCAEELLVAPRTAATKDSSLRIVVTDVTKDAPGGGRGGMLVYGHVAAGTLKPREKLVALPGQLALVPKAVWASGDEDASAASLTDKFTNGENVVLSVPADDYTERIRRGFVLVPAAITAVSLLANRIVADIVTFDVEIPLTLGFGCILHVHALEEHAFIKAIRSCSDLGGQRQSPRFVPSQSVAQVEFWLEAGSVLPLERYADCPKLGCFVMRLKGRTVGSGKVVDFRCE